MIIKNINQQKYHQKIHKPASLLHLTISMRLFTYIYKCFPQCILVILLSSSCIHVNNHFYYPSTPAHPLHSVLSIPTQSMLNHNTSCPYTTPFSYITISVSLLIHNMLINHFSTSASLTCIIPSTCSISPACIIIHVHHPLTITSIILYPTSHIHLILSLTLPRLFLHPKPTMAHHSPIPHAQTTNDESATPTRCHTCQQL